MEIARLRIEPKVLCQTWIAEGRLCFGYHLEIRNHSAARSVCGVKVRLLKIDPEVSSLNYLPVPLHLKHDNRPEGASEFTYAKEFDLHPGDDPQHVDLIAASVGAETITVEHIAERVNKSIPPGKYRFTIIATGRDVRQSKAIVEAWVDDAGVLRCVAL